MALRLLTLREEALAKCASFHKRMDVNSYVEFPPGTSISPSKLPLHTVAHALANSQGELVIWVKVNGAEKSDDRLARLQDLSTDDLIKLIGSIESAQLLNKPKVGMN